MRAWTVLGGQQRPPDFLKLKKEILKLGMKAAVTTADLIKVLDSRRISGRQRLNVGQVNVQSGGQAIIGNIRNTNSGPAPSAPAGGGGDEEEEEGGQ